MKRIKRLPKVNTDIKSSDSSFEKEVSFGERKINFADKASKDVGFRFTTEAGEYLGFKIPGATNKTGVVDKSKINWSVDSLLNVEFEVTQQGVKANYTLKTKPAKNDLVLDLETENLAFIKNKDGSYSVYGEMGNTGIQRFFIPKPFAIDATGKKTDVDIDITGFTCTLTVPQKFLDEATYPVVVDPTTIANNTGDAITTAYYTQRKVSRDDSGFWYVLYGVMDTGLRSVRLKKSSNTAGTAWGAEVNLAGPAGTGTVYFFEPGADHQQGASMFLERTGVQATNNLHIVWQDRTGNNTANYTVCTDLSDVTNVNNWFEADQSTNGYEAIPSGAGNAQGNYPTIVITSTGEAAVGMWGLEVTNSYNVIHFTRYNAGWLNPAISILEDGTQDAWHTLTIDSGDKLHLVWRSDNEAPRQIHYKSVAFASADLAANWKKRDGTAGFDVVINQGVNHVNRPTMVCDKNDKLWLATDISVSLDIWYNFTSSPTAWNDATGAALDTVGNLSQPSVGVGADNEVYIFYIDDSNNNLVFQSSSITGAPAWSGKTVLYNGANTQSFPSAEANPRADFSNLGVLWTEFDGADRDVLFEIVILSPAVRNYQTLGNANSGRLRRGFPS